MTNKGDCQRYGGRELASDGMVNLGELLINVVRTNKLKALTSLSQKARGQGNEFPSSRTVVRTATGEQAGPNPSVIRARNVVSPHASQHGKAHRKVCRWAWG